MKHIVCSYETYEKYCRLFDNMKFKAGSYAPTEEEIFSILYPRLEVYILFLLWIEMTGYETEENKKSRKVIRQIIREEMKVTDAGGEL